jgi:quinoprotein dehydrogenase-associated probable ABC transporter substrate-binding protein
VSLRNTSLLASRFVSRGKRSIRDSIFETTSFDNQESVMKKLPFALLAVGLFNIGNVVADDSVKSITVCADPGNMPLSNQKGEGFENKIAQALGESIGAGIQYYWRPSIERGLMRTTLSEGNCDVWMDMASDTEGAEVLTPPLYRSTFVFAYRSDKNYGTFKTLDDPRLDSLRIGVFQVSAVRQALAEHGIMSNTVIHYLSHNGDLIGENQPSFQVQQVIDGGLDIAAEWGPMAGYYKTIKKAPIVIQPLNTIDNTVPRGKPEIKAVVSKGLQQAKDSIHKILDDYGVPLVQCSTCIISGNLPSHGEYKTMTVKPETLTADKRPSRLPALKAALAEGASPKEELGNAVIANDRERVTYMLAQNVDVNARSGDGYPPLINAVRFSFAEMTALLIKNKADVNASDISHWTPLMYAAWTDNAAMIKTLVKAGAKIETGDEDGLTPLGIASQNGKSHAVDALISAGADVNRGVGQGGYTPLMLATSGKSDAIATTLIKHGANVNAKNAGGVTPLMVAAGNDAASIGSMLLKSGADVSAKSEDGRTALAIAKSNNSEGVLKLLQQNGAANGSKSG